MSVDEIILKYSETPFSYGVDCCSFAGECLEAVGRKNPMRTIGYEGSEEAEQIVSSYGSLREAIINFLGEPRKNTAYAEEYDVVLCEKEGEQIAGIVLRCGMENELRCVLRTQTSLVDVPLDRASFVWRTD